MPLRLEKSASLICFAFTQMKKRILCIQAYFDESINLIKSSPTHFSSIVHVFCIKMNMIAKLTNKKQMFISHTYFSPSFIIVEEPCLILYPKGGYHGFVIDFCFDSAKKKQLRNRLTSVWKL